MPEMQYYFVLHFRRFAYARRPNRPQASLCCKQIYSYRFCRQLKNNSLRTQKMDVHPVRSGRASRKKMARAT